MIAISKTVWPKGFENNPTVLPARLLAGHMVLDASTKNVAYHHVLFEAHCNDYERLLN